MDNLLSPICIICDKPARFKHCQWLAWCGPICFQEWKKLKYPYYLKLGTIRPYCKKCQELPAHWVISNDSYSDYCIHCYSKINILEHLCLECKTPAIDSKKKFCSTGCRDKYIYRDNKLTPQCLYCAEPSYYTKDHWSPWCSRQCRIKWVGKKQIGYIWNIKNRPLCAYCLETPVFWYSIKKQFADFCFDCYNEYQRRIQKCLACENFIKYNTETKSFNNFCSIECRNYYMSKSINEIGHKCEISNCYNMTILTSDGDFLEYCPMHSNIKSSANI